MCLTHYKAAKTSILPMFLWFLFFLKSSLNIQLRLRVSTPTPSVGGTSIRSAKWRIRVGAWRCLCCLSQEPSACSAKFSHCILLSSPLPPRHLARHQSILVTAETNSGLNLAFIICRSTNVTERDKRVNINLKWAPSVCVHAWNLKSNRIKSCLVQLKY